MSSFPGSPVGRFLVLTIVCSVGLLSYFYWVKTRTSISSVTQSGDGAVRPQTGERPSRTDTSSAAGAVPAPEHALTAKARAADDTGARREPVSRSELDVSGTASVKVLAPKQIFFRHTAAGSNFGRLAVVDYPDLRPPRFVGDLSCEVFHVAAGVGLCLTADRGMFTKFGADLLDSTFTRRFHFDLQGIPSRCRVSPDGKFAAWTVFLAGHSYASADFSTQTVLVNTTTGELLGNLEEFAVSLDGQPFKSADFNFWGVTFAPDSKSFYCTLSSNRKHYLVKGDINSRKLSVIRENAECPSMSPDGTRIAYKKRNTVSGRPAWIPPPEMLWQLHVLELATMSDTPLAELRSVDDQLAWLDNLHVLYALPADQTDSSASTNVWMVSIDGKGPPGLFLPAAYSPAVVR
jgi:hypothetical protein